MGRSRVHRAMASLVVAIAAFATTGAPAFAVEPIDLREDGASTDATAPRVAPARPAPAPSRSTPTPAPTPGPTETPAADDGPEIGYDVSYPQCGDELPERFAFAIVGVNGGRVYTDNRCLVESEDEIGQLEWAGRDVELYANTGNPGPRDSRHWPEGQEDPRSCPEPMPLRSSDTLECAYVYGWNAAADSYQIALEAFIELGWAEEGAERLPWETTWWLDVETANSWRLDWRANVAALEGARDYLVSRDVAEVGFYSTPRMWFRITGGIGDFADHPAWHAGATDESDARARCLEEDAFTGGELRMVQWVEDGLDHNLRCEDVAPED